MGSIIVGIDGSAQSHRALAWALDEARLRNAEVTIVHAHLPDTIDVYGMGGMVTADQLQAYSEEFERQHQQVVDDALEEVADRVQDVTVQAKVERGWSPAHAIVEYSKDADLVVVGSRGRGGFAGVLLGSVSQQVAQHAHCPVVIVGAQKDD